MTRPQKNKTEDLIQAAYKALREGDRTTAYDSAQSVIEETPDSEQAWLILASLNEGEQSLRCLENALRANPDSQAARKAIRLVVKQMAGKDRKSIPDQAGARLSDTSPIPIEKIVEPPAEELSTKEEPDKSKSAIETESAVEPKIKELDTAAAESKAGSPTKKEILRKKLQKRTTVPTQPAQTENKALKIIREEKAAEVPQPASSPPPASIAETPMDEIEEVPLKIKTNVVQEPVVSKPEKKTSKPARQRAKKKEKVRAARSSRSKKAAKRAEKDIKNTFNKEIKKIKDKEKREMDIDIIELVLISLAAILLPLMAFLYFFFTNK
jgi:hypothetical protein